MSGQVYSVPGQAKVRRKTFLEWKSRESSYKLSLTCGGNVNYYKRVYPPISARANRKHSGNFQNKPVSSPFDFMFRYSLNGQTEGRGKPFLKGARKGTTL